MAEKTEKATPKKLRDARKKGQIAKAQDFPAACTFVVSMVGTLAAAYYLFEQISSFMIAMFREAGSNPHSFEGKIPGYFQQAINIILFTSAPILVVVSFIGILVSFLVNGPVFSFEPMKFDLKKLNPIEGIKQKFKLKVLVELLKSIAKITGAAIIIYLVILELLPDIISTVRMPVLISSLVVKEFLLKTTIRVGIFFLIVALFDLGFQKKNFAKEMKMEKFEVKQEYKDTEGDPQIKWKRKELSREIAYQDGPGAAKRARAIVTNPQHIAVAIKYDPEEGEPAPKILVMGVDLVAEQIIKIGIQNKIPIMRNVELARTLYRNGKISEYIPEETYPAVAEILKWIEALEQNPDVNKELFT